MKGPPRLQVGDLVRLKEPRDKPDGVKPTTVRILALNHSGMESVTRLDRRLDGVFYLHIERLEKA
jgi:hypothetical protein